MSETTNGGTAAAGSAPPHPKPSDKGGHAGGTSQSKSAAKRRRKRQNAAKKKKAAEAGAGVATGTDGGGAAPPNAKSADEKSPPPDPKVATGGQHGKEEAGKAHPPKKKRNRNRKKKAKDDDRDEGRASGGVDASADAAAAPTDRPKKPPSTLRITNLPPDVTEADVRKMFQKFGRMSGVELVRDADGGAEDDAPSEGGKPSALVGYARKHDAEYVMKRHVQHQGFKLKGAKLGVEWETGNADAGATIDEDAGEGSGRADDGTDADLGKEEGPLLGSKDVPVEGGDDTAAAAAADARDAEGTEAIEVAEVNSEACALDEGMEAAAKQTAAVPEAAKQSSIMADATYDEGEGGEGSSIDAGVGADAAKEVGGDSEAAVDATITGEEAADDVGKADMEPQKLDDDAEPGAEPNGDLPVASELSSSVDDVPVDGGDLEGSGPIEASVDSAKEVGGDGEAAADATITGEGAADDVAKADVEPQKLDDDAEPEAEPNGDLPVASELSSSVDGVPVDGGDLEGSGPTETGVDSDPVTEGGLSPDPEEIPVEGGGDGEIVTDAPNVEERAADDVAEANSEASGLDKGMEQAAELTNDVPGGADQSSIVADVTDGKGNGEEDGSTGTGVGADAAKEEGSSPKAQDVAVEGGGDSDAAADATITGGEGADDDAKADLAAKHLDGDAEPVGEPHNGVPVLPVQSNKAVDAPADGVDGERSGPIEAGVRSGAVKKELAAGAAAEAKPIKNTSASEVPTPTDVHSTHTFGSRSAPFVSVDEDGKVADSSNADKEKSQCDCAGCVIL